MKGQSPCWIDNFAFSCFHYSDLLPPVGTSMYSINFILYHLTDVYNFFYLRNISCQALWLLLKYYEFLYFNTVIIQLHANAFDIFFFCCKIKCSDGNQDSYWPWNHHIGLLAFTLNDEKFSYHKNILMFINTATCHRRQN